MADRAALLLRLRRLINDTGRGYSRSSPGAMTAITGLASPALTLHLDGGLAATVSLLPANLSTPTAVAAEIQRKVRLAGTSSSYKNFVCIWGEKDGYQLYSGSIGSSSSVNVVPAASGDDVSALLKLGLAHGGYESPGIVEFSDDELSDILDQAVDAQNVASNSSAWTVSTLPPQYETIIAYRGWETVVNSLLGRYSTAVQERVGDVETYNQQAFANLLKLASSIGKKIEDLMAEVDGNIEVSTVSTWNYLGGGFVPESAFSNPMVQAIIRSILWEGATSAILEFDPINCSDLMIAHIGYREGDGVQVVDKAIFSEADYESAYGGTQGFVAPSVLYRSLRVGKDSVVRVTGLDNTKDYTFQIVTVDMAGTRYFSNAITLKAGA